VTARQARATKPKASQGATSEGQAPRRRPGRKVILQRAAELFATAGYGGTSMRDIAEAAAVMAGSLYSHFDSKAAILQELMDSYYAELLPRQRAVLQESGTALERLERMVAEIAEVAHAHPEVAMVVVLDWHDIVTLPELASIVVAARESDSLFRTVIEEGLRTGELRPDIHVEAVARLLASAITGLIDRRFLIPSEAAPGGSDLSASQIAACINMLLGGLVLTPAIAKRTPSQPRSSSRRPRSPS
jgi:AcrR family transcriptional regulator